jgi:hypothetical protein
MGSLVEGLKCQEEGAQADVNRLRGGWASWRGMVPP